MMKKISNLEIGGYSPLLQKYLNDSSFRLNELGFSLDNKMSDVGDRIKYLQTQKYERKKLVQSLRAYHKKFKTSDAIQKNLDLLENEQTVCVVTGQQPAIAGGPLYNLYKAISVLQLAEQIKTQLSCQVVPIFWVAGNDSDVMEANRLYYTDANRRLKRYSFSGLNDIPLNELKAYDCFLHLKEELSHLIHRTDYYQDAIKIICSEENDSFADWQSRILLQLFGEKGLIIVEPKSLVPISADAFKKLINNEDQIIKQISDNSKNLEKKNFSVQVDQNVSSRWMLYREGKGRKRLEKSNGVYQVDELKIKSEDLFEFSQNTKSALTPDALFRPLWQDLLLPTVAYCGGPAEIAYFHQLKGCYEICGKKMPLILPRLGATILEKNHQRFMAKQHIPIEKFYQLSDIIKPQTPTYNVSENELQKLFQAWQSQVQNDDELKVFSRFKNKFSILHERFYEKLGHTRMNVSGVGKKQLEEWKDFIWPKQQLQERCLSPLYFLSRHGPDFFNILLDMKYEFGAHYIFALDQE